MNCKLALAISFGILSFVSFRFLTKTYTLPKLDINKYWGPGNGSNYVENTTIHNLRFIFEQHTINGLVRRLERTLDLQTPIEGSAFRYGFNSNAMRPIIDYWRAVYLKKWKVREEYINEFRHRMTQINGLFIHYIHEVPKELRPATHYIRVPILLLHGWPGSVREFFDIIPKLTSYSDDHIYGFEVVAPSLVGFGFSSYTTKKSFNIYEMAIVMRNLMLRLGYDRFFVQGGDWGSIIGSQMATIFPENVIGYHSNMCVLQSPLSFAKAFIASFYPTLFVKEEYQHFHFPITEKLRFLIEESGYFHLQATKPDTIGIALAANPVGLAAYILEKFSTGMDFENRDLDDGGLYNENIDLDAIFDNIMIYYLTNTITSSMRFYSEAVSSAQRAIPFDSIPTDVPMACIRFKNDLPTAFDWQLRDKFPNLVQSTYVNSGGHFAAMEVPDVLYKDIIEFVKKVCIKENCSVKVNSS